MRAPFCAWAGCVPLFERMRFRGDRDVVGRAFAVRASAGSLFACGRMRFRRDSRRGRAFAEMGGAGGCASARLETYGEAS